MNNFYVVATLDVDPLCFSYLVGCYPDEKIANFKAEELKGKHPKIKYLVWSEDYYSKACKYMDQNVQTHECFYCYSKGTRSQEFQYLESDGNWQWTCKNCQTKQKS